MIDREVAWRVFAHEFNHADHFFHEGDERSPNYLVTPTGARINRLYFVGVLTELENIGVEEDMWRARVSDPTGAFSVYASQYQPEATVFLSGLDVPSFVTLMGKARTYEPEEGTIYTSVRPEELNNANGRIRDVWVVDTARLTFERIRLVRAALESGLSGDELTNLLRQQGANKHLADGISRAVAHYPDLNSYLDTLSEVVINALKTILPAKDQGFAAASELQTGGGTEYITEMDKSSGTDRVPGVEGNSGTDDDSKGLQVNENTAGYTTDTVHPEVHETAGVDVDAVPHDIDEVQPGADDIEPDEVVYEIMGRLDSGKGVSTADLMDESNRSGLTEEQVNDAMKTLMSEGRCYEPQIGVLRRV